MASKRKSTPPCMVLARETEPEVEVVSDVEEVALANTPPGSLSSDEDSQENVDSDNQFNKKVEGGYECKYCTFQTPDLNLFTFHVDSEHPHSDNQFNKKVEGGYECKYCTFQTPDLNLFTFHVDSEHPHVVLSSSYVCLECKFVTKRYDALLEHNTKYHPGEDNFKLTMVKRNNQTIFEQTVNDLTFDGSFVQEEKGEEMEGAEGSLSGISISKTPIMKMIKNKNDTKRIAVFHNAADDGPNENKEAESDPECEEVTENPPPVVTEGPTTPSAETVSKVCEPIISPTTVIHPAQLIAGIASAQNAGLLSKVLIPINSIPTYNTALDNNPLLLNTYNKFPYPTVSEIALLATEAKYTEEQVKIWFSAQRLKHGVSWTPEEVEEARRKQFNGTVHTVPQTITVIPAHISTAANGLQSILQTCQIVGQSGLVLAQVAGAGTLPMTTPIALTVAGVPSQTQLQRAQVLASQPATETKQVAAIPAAQLTKSELVATAVNIDMVGGRTKKTKEQLTELKISYLKNHFPFDSEILRLMKITGLTKGEIKKWFSDTRYNQRNSKQNHYNHLHTDSSTIVIDSGDETNEPLTTAQPQQKNSEFKEKTAEQLKILQDSFSNNPVLTDDELNRIESETNLTKREIDMWFAEQNRPNVLHEESEEVSENNMGSLRETYAAETSGGEGPGTQKLGKLSKKKPEQLHMLKMSFIRTQWPSAAEYDQLAEESGVPRPEIVSWFGDTRYAWKNGSLKWYYYYQGGNARSSMNGQGSSRKRGRGRPKGRGRGRSRGRPRAHKKLKHWDRTPVIKFKTGKAILKDYYLKHKFLNEQDLDELVAKSHMGYEQVREWFAERQRRTDLGLELFEEEEEEEEEEELLEDPGEEDDEEDGEESDDSDTWEPPRHVRRKLSKTD